MLTPKNKPVVLLILDGWGHRESNQEGGNAIAQAQTPTWDNLIKNYPHTLISGCGEDVGLPQGQMGNSEVGHITLGAGRVLYQDLTRITKEIKDGNFFKNLVLENAFAKADSNHRAVHIMGLLSPGGVHSHEDHIFACIKMAREKSKGPIYVHAFLDGRDTPPQSARNSLEKLEVVLNTYQAKLATVTGRYFAMDRDQRWERVQAAFEAIVYGNAHYEAPNSIAALDAAYARGETDEFVKPTCIKPAHQEPIILQDNDVVIYMNFRADRARALSYALTSNDFTGFDRGHYPKIAELVTLTEYDTEIKSLIAYKPQALNQVLGEYLQDLHLTQLRLAETEKYAHVTFFFNGGIEKPFFGEERILVPSPKVATYDLQPEMSAPEVTRLLVKHILEKKFDVIICNYANADMVGHTGNLPAAIKAIETLDSALKEITQALDKVGGEMLITADHGNAECMIDDVANQPHTAHTLSLVPLLYFGKQKIRLREGGTLQDVAPTLLALMELPQPQEMTGHTLIETL